MSSITTLSDFAIAARPALFDMYGLDYAKLHKFYEEVAKISKMNGYVDEDIRIAGLGRMQRKLDGEAYRFDKMTQEFLTRYIAVDYALGSAISKRAIEQAKGMNLLAMVSKELANASVQERNHKVAALFNNAFNSSAQAMSDGAALCTTASVNQSGLSGSNKMAVDADFSESALETLLIQIQTEARNTRGEIIPLVAEKLVIHPSIQFEVKRILNSSLRAGTTDNDANVHKGMFGESDICMSPLLSDSDAWFVLTNVNGDGHGIVVKEARPLSIETKDDFDTSAVKIKAETSFIVGISDRLAVYGSQGGA